MRLAILGCRGIPARYGGFETFAEEIAIRLVDRGFSVTVYCQGTAPEPHLAYKGVDLQYIPAPKLGKFDQLAWDLRCLWHARSGYDVVYLLGYGASILCWLPRLFGSQMWINTDGIEWARTKWKWWQRWYVQFSEMVATLTASRLITDSASVAAYFRKRYKHLPAVNTIAYGAYPVVERPDENWLSELQLVPGEYYLTVCRLEPENHILEIIEGFKQSRSHCPLIIVGDHTLSSRYINQLLTYAGNGVRFIGAVYDPARLRALRYFCRAYLHGHSVGGTNPSLLEAMACGNLVIAHDNPFNREVLRDAGLYFSDPREASAQFKSLDNAEVDPAPLKFEAVEIIKQSYTWDLVTDAYEELLTRKHEYPAAPLPEELETRTAKS